MKLALLAADQTPPEWLAELVRSHGVQIAWGAGPGPSPHESGRGPWISCEEARMRLAAGGAVDAVEGVILLGCDPELRELAERSARTGGAVIVAPDVRLTADWVYALHPLADDGAARLLPVWPHTGAAAVEALQSRFSSLREAASPGAVEIDCRLPGGPLTRERIAAQLLLDADLLRRLLGDHVQLLAAPAEGAQGELASLAITFSGPHRPAATITYRPGTTFHWRLTWTGAAEPNALEQPSPGVFRTAPGSAADGDVRDARRAAALLAEQLAGPRSAAPWKDLLRAFDVVGAAERSLGRRRAVPIEGGVLSPELQFKSLMSALGCGVLLYTLVAAVALLCLAGLFDPRDSLQRNAEAAGFVVPVDAWIDAGDAPSPGFSGRIDDIAKNWGRTTEPVIVEAADPPNQVLDARRRTQIIDALLQAGTTDAPSRVEVRALRGRWFRRVVWAAWGLVFAPLAVFLLLQGLIVVNSRERRAAPASGESPP